MPYTVQGEQSLSSSEALFAGATWGVMVPVHDSFTFTLCSRSGWLSSEMVDFETGLTRLFNWSMLEAVFIWVFDVGHLDEHAFVFGNGVKWNNCFPLSTIQDPVCHETSGEGETIMSASVKLLQGDSTGSVSGSLLLPLINLPFPFAAVSRHVPRVFFEIASVSTGPVSSACFSLEDHCCLQRKSMMVKRTAIPGAHT